MKDRIFEQVNGATSLEEVRFAVVRAFEEVKAERGTDRIGYVSGIITSDGPEYIERNMQRLEAHTALLRANHPFPIFSATDVFSDRVFESINAHTIPVQGWLDFWSDVLKAGHVTDIFMTPRWEVSTGARDEYKVAQEIGLTIHQITEAHHAKEKPFEGLKIYYSGSIKGVPEAEPDFPWQLVQYMGKGGADVLSEHVAARNSQEMDEIRAKRWGMEIQEMLAQPEPWVGIRKKDIEWVDQASHVVALVNAPSHGVGMEIERAILKPERGLNETPILCLVHEQMLDKTSFMIRGVTKEESPKFQLRTYSNLEEAKVIVHEFLTEKNKS